jgi:MFS transporter, FSR family, fosmidomycin resistance protein
VSADTRQGRGAEAPPIDRRAIVPFSVAHGCADLCQGAVPALLPSLIAHRGLDLASATALVTAATIASSIVQPLFGIWSDRLDFPLLAPLGVVIAGLGLGVVGLTHSYAALAIALAISGLGVALFHPEAARMAGRAGRGTARGMSYFSVGGNVGFAVGPLAVLLILAIGGISATPLLVVPGVAVAALLVLDVERFKSHLQAEHRSQQTRSREQKAQWGPFSRLVGAAVARTVPFYTVLALVPIYAVRRLGASHSVGSVALTVMLVAGAAGTLIGARCADRFGKRMVLVWAMVPLTVFLVILSHTGLALTFVILALIGFTLDAPFSTTVVLGQQYLPGRRGLASGITFGLAIGMGGLIATGLGATADAIGIHTTLEILPAFSLIALGCVLSLPKPRD